MDQNKYSVSAQPSKYVQSMHHKLATVTCLLGEHTFNHALDFSAHHQPCWPPFDPSVHFNNNGSGSVPQVMVHIRKVVTLSSICRASSMISATAFFTSFSFESSFAIISLPLSFFFHFALGSPSSIVSSEKGNTIF